MVVLRALLTLFAFVVAVLDTIVMGSYGTIVGLIPPPGDWTLRGARLWAKVILLGAFVRLRVEGAERVPRDGPVVFMANHESWIDIPALLAAIPVQVRFLAKKSLFSVPFLGWAMAAMRFIPVDRENRRNAVRSFEEAAERIRRGRSVLIFPEETRTADGELLPFQRGAFLIAIKAGLPVVPMAIVGARRCLPKHSYLLRSGTVTVRFGAPVPTEALGVTAKTSLMDEVRGRISALRGNTPPGGAVPADGATAQGETRG